MKERLNEINNELKDYMNESSFISNKCRNKIIKMLGDEFDINLPTDNFKTVDISLNDKGSIIMRGDLYEGKELSKEEIEERYSRFKEKADSFLKRKDISFKNKSIKNNIINLIIVLIIILLTICALYYGIKAIIQGNYVECLWFIIILSWIVSPRLKENVRSRFSQANRFIKSIIKKVK